MAVSLLRAEELSSQQLYESKCKSCHGKAGEGNAAMAKALKVDPSVLTLNKKLEKTDVELVVFIKDGKGKMPAFKAKLTDDQIKGLVEYIRTLSKE